MASVRGLRAGRETLACLEKPESSRENPSHELRPSVSVIKPLGLYRSLWYKEFENVRALL
jgi:hypothetical protein